MYQDDYPTCGATYASLCIYHDDLDPDNVTARLGISPSETRRKGETRRSGHVIPVGGWFISSKGHVESRDVRRHIAWILDQIAESEDELQQLQNEGCDMQVFCYWLSASGHGGPELNHEIMRRLVSLRLDIEFDVYC